MINDTIRAYFQLKLIDNKWEKIPLKGNAYEVIYISQEGYIEKYIFKSRDSIFYKETDYHIALNNERQIVGKRGKIQKISAAVIEKIKPTNKALFINSNSISLINWDNKIQVIDEFNLKLKSEENVLEFFDTRLKNPTEFEQALRSKFLDNKKSVRQKFKAGDVFRIRLGGRKFGYGRVISDLKKLMNYKPIPVGEQNLGWKRNHIFNPFLFHPVWVDYYSHISNDPYLKVADLKNYKTTPSVQINSENLKNGNFGIIDKTEIDLESFDVPFEIETHYEYVPKYHIFKWGLGVLTFPICEKLESLRELRYPMNYRPNNLRLGAGIKHFIQSSIEGEISFKSISMYGDLREDLFNFTRKTISKNIGVDIDKVDYDSFAAENGFMTKKEILNYCKKKPKSEIIL